MRIALYHIQQLHFDKFSGIKIIFIENNKLKDTTMHRHFITPAFLFLLSFLMFSPTYAEELLMISGNPEAPPVMWEKSGKMAGIGPELVTSILDAEGVKYTIGPAGSWKEVQNKARTGEVDLVVAAYDNKERRTYMEYSIPYLKSPVVILVKKGDTFSFTSWNDLIGKKGVANTGESFGEKFDTFIKEKLDVQFIPYESAFRMVSEDEADYLIIDLYPAVIYSKMLLAEDKVEYLDNPATVQYFHVTMSKKTPHLGLMSKINTHITKMKEQGQIKKMALEQYAAWNKTFKERQRLFERANIDARKSQVEYDAGAHDRGLDNLARFIERDLPYLSN
jgi:polar amino acid transport system substrate-binding protein